MVGLCHVEVGADVEVANELGGGHKCVDENFELLDLVGVKYYGEERIIKHHDDM